MSAWIDVSRSRGENRGEIEGEIHCATSRNSVTSLPAVLELSAGYEDFLMKHHLPWRSIAGIVLSVALAVNQAEPALFAQSDAAPQAVPATSPGSPAAGPRAAQSFESPAPRPRKSPLKWILIAAAAAGTAIVLAVSKKQNPSPEPGTITIGPPTVGQP